MAIGKLIDLSEQLSSYALPICDMIKGNESDVRNIDFELQAKLSDESDVRNIDFELQAKVSDKCVCIVFECQRICHISATRCPIEMWFGSKCSILNGQVTYIENVTHSP